MPRGVPKHGHRTRSMGIGVVGEAMRSFRPSLLEGAVQHAGEAIPPHCPKCHSEWFAVDEWEARCLCGRRFYRTVGTIRRKPKEAPA